MLDRFTNSSGLLCVVSGPSGVGKDCVLDALLSEAKGIAKCVTATTRDPRPGELNGIDYIFLSSDEFSQMVSNGDFLEYAEVHGNMYGTPKAEVSKITSQGFDVILKIDVQGGISVRASDPDAILIFILPPSVEELERRLRGRGTDSEESVQCRLHNAQNELSLAKEYDYVVVNNTIAGAVHDIEAIISAEHHRVQKI
jgi:guanylate kinase